MIAYPDRAELALLPTPLGKLERLGAQLGREIFCKRDDLTGSTLSGNKVRKLEFLFADAIAQGCDTVLTCGGEQSNHCRATAFAATQLGLACQLFLRTENPAAPPAAQANILLDHLAGAKITWVSRPEYQRRQELFAARVAELRRAGKKPYVIPEGGSNSLGSWGYVRCVEELTKQLPAHEPATLVYAAGSGGTGAGLIVGQKLFAPAWRVVGINVCDDHAYFERVIGEIVEDMVARYKLTLPFSRSEIELIDGYVGRGYAQSRPEELRDLISLSQLEGITLDPVYTGKAYFGMRRELEKNADAFGKRIVFLHTGGLFGLFAKAPELAALFS